VICFLLAASVFPFVGDCFTIAPEFDSACSVSLVSEKPLRFAAYTATGDPVMDIEITISALSTGKAIAGRAQAFHREFPESFGEVDSDTSSVGNCRGDCATYRGKSSPEAKAWRSLVLVSASTPCGTLLVAFTVYEKSIPRETRSMISIFLAGFKFGE